MSDQGKGRYDRSRYGSGGERDSFFDEMRISAADPTASRTVSDYSRKSVEESNSYSSEKRHTRTAHAHREPAPDGQAEAATASATADASHETVAREPHPARGARKSRGTVFKVVIVAIVAVVLIGAGAAFAYFTSISNNLREGVDDDLLNALVETDMANEPFYILLLGTDGSAERDDDPEYGGGYRSDSMMLARVDPVDKKATLVSIGRDILVNMGGEHTQEKINAAYAIGGPAKAVEVVSDLAGVPISHYAQVDFDGFAAMVDALGGVEVDVPMSFDDSDAGGALEAGVQTLNGEQALVLCRMRNAYSDVATKPDEMRAANQRLVLSAIAKKALSSDIATIAGTVQALSEYVTTDLDLADIIGLAQVMKGINPDTDIYTASVPTTSQVIGDGWYEIVKKDEWAAMMKRVKAGEPPLEEAVVDEATGTVMATAGDGIANATDKYATVTVKNATDTMGLATSARSKLMEAGFVNVVVGEITDQADYPETLVVYDLPGRAREADEIVEVIGQGRAMENDGSYLLLDTDFIVVIGKDWDTSK